jgi:hypothetical protein
VRYRQFRRRHLTRRLLDDWGYQTIVRPHLAMEVVPRLGVGGSQLGDAAGSARDVAVRMFREQVLPPVERALGQSGLAGVSFPWNRLFEVDVHLPDLTQAFEGTGTGD